MDASRISMARLLAYLFEVTERFGMETRTELILLQRTMVVVEGVARSLDPDINIWVVARPVVEEYITEHVGPKAVRCATCGRPCGFCRGLVPGCPHWRNRRCWRRPTRNATAPAQPLARAGRLRGGGSGARRRGLRRDLALI
jgi:hypothetical protein